MEEKFSTLIVDGDGRYAKRLGFLLEQDGFDVAYAPTLAEAADELKSLPRQFVILACSEPRWVHTTHLQEITAAAPQAHFLVLLAQGCESAEQVLRHIGFGEFLPREMPSAQLAAILRRHRAMRMLERENYRFKQLMEFRTCYESLLGGSAPMRALYRLLDQVSKADAPVLISGETGTELRDAARAIHLRSERCMYPVVIVDAAQGEPAAQEKAIFGAVGRGQHARGPSPEGSAFARAGKGTLIIDRIEALGADAQARLLAFFHNPFFQGETSTSAHPVARIMGISREDLQAKVAEEKFNRELYYRMNILHVRMPPLRERREDIPMLAEHALSDHPATDATGGGKKRPAFTFSDDALLCLFKHSWPRNVEELNEAVKASAKRARGLQIEVEDLPIHFTKPPEKAESATARPVAANVPLRSAKRSFESEYFKNLLERTGGNMTMASRISKVGRPYLYKKLREYEIDPEAFRKAA